MRSVKRRGEPSGLSCQGDYVKYLTLFGAWGTYSGSATVDTPKNLFSPSSEAWNDFFSSNPGLFAVIYK